MQMPLAYTWALATPVILWLGRRFPFERGRWPSSGAIHLAIWLTFVVLLDLAYAFHISNALPQPPNPQPAVQRAAPFLVVGVVSGGLLYLTIPGVSVAV